MSRPKIITNEFTILKNGFDSNIEIIRHDKTGFYNITKTAKMIAQVSTNCSSDVVINISKCKKICYWFENESTKQLMAECQRVSHLDVVRYELAKGTPKQFAGTYVHELLYDQFIMWLSPIYAMRIAAILRDFHKEVIQVITTQIQLCATPDCPTQANVLKYKGYCFDCFYRDNPYEPVIRNYKVKETTIMDSIGTAIGHGHIVRDKVIGGSGCKRRPDGLIQLAGGDHNIVIEIDEHQHKSPGYVDEDQRIYEIYEALGSRALTVIRFNPDQFNGLDNGLFYKSESTGLVDVSDHDRYTHAVDKLIEIVRNAMDTPPVDPDSIVEIKLRFDHAR